MADDEAGDRDLLSYELCGEGFRVLAVKSLRPEIPVILMTGYGLEDRAGAALNEACAFFSKPFEVSELKTAVKISIK